MAFGPMVPLRIAHDQADTGSLSGTMPNPNSTAVTSFFGNPIPRFEAAFDEGTASFRCRKQRNGPCRMRAMGAHGHAHSKVAGVGHYGRKHTGVMEDALFG